MKIEMLVTCDVCLCGTCLKRDGDNRDYCKCDNAEKETGFCVEGEFIAKCDKYEAIENDE